VHEAGSANEVWVDLLTRVYSSQTSTSPRGLLTKELLGCQTKVDMTRPVISIKGRKLGRRFLAAEAWWILTGRNDVASISPYSKDISKFSDDGKRFSGAYGPAIVDQLTFVCDALTSDQDTRQAVATIWRRNPRPSKDVPCTVACQWLIRGGKLHCVDTMRSSDVWLGFPYDVFNFSMLSAMILLTLRQWGDVFKDVGLGTLILTAGSQHLYESNFKAVEQLFDDLSADQYAPLDVDDFSSPEQLVGLLECRKDGKYFGLPWMKELY